MQIDAAGNDAPTTPTAQAWSESDDCGIDIEPQMNPCRFPSDSKGAFYGEINTAGDIDWIGSQFLRFEIGKTYTIDVLPRGGVGVHLRCPKLVGLYGTNENLVAGTANARLPHTIEITTRNSGRARPGSGWHVRRLDIGGDRPYGRSAAVAVPRGRRQLDEGVVQAAAEGRLNEWLRPVGIAVRALAAVLVVGLVLRWWRGREGTDV